MKPEEIPSWISHPYGGMEPMNIERRYLVTPSIGII